MKISFLASHGGSAAKHICSNLNYLIADCYIGCVITNNAASEIRRWSKENYISTYYLSGKTHPNDSEKDIAILNALMDSGTDLIVLSGYMKKIGPKVLKQFRNKILNIHPSLLPSFGGQGMYGDRVHKAVLKSQNTISGATVHLVNSEYDDGPILCQKEVTVLDTDNLKSLKQKIQAVEGDLFLDGINKVIQKL